MTKWRMWFQDRNLGKRWAVPIRLLCIFFGGSALSTVLRRILNELYQLMWTFFLCVSCFFIKLFNQFTSFRHDHCFCWFMQGVWVETGEKEVAIKKIQSCPLDHAKKGFELQSGWRTIWIQSAYMTCFVFHFFFIKLFIQFTSRRHKQMLLFVLFS